jgi:hypothetical protein
VLDLPPPRVALFRVAMESAQEVKLVMTRMWFPVTGAHPIVRLSLDILAVVVARRLEIPVRLVWPVAIV